MKPSSTEPATEPRARRGVSLIELIVAAGLFSLVMLLAYAFLHAGYRYMRNSNASMDLQRSLLTAMVNLKRELIDSTPASVSISQPPGPSGIYFASARDDQGKLDFQSGRAVWQKWVCYYLQGEDLVRCEQDLPAPSSTAPDPSTVSLSGFINGSMPKRLVSRGIRVLEITPGSPLVFRVEGWSQAEQGQFMAEVTSKIFPRN